jgi:hypothetical protein
MGGNPMSAFDPKQTSPGLYVTHGKLQGRAKRFKYEPVFFYDNTSGRGEWCELLTSFSQH